MDATAVMDQSDEDALLGMQLELSIALEACAMKVVELRQQGPTPPFHPFPCMAEPAATTCAPAGPSHTCYTTDPMTENGQSPRFGRAGHFPHQNHFCSAYPNAASVEPYSTSHGNSTPLPQTWHGGYDYTSAEHQTQHYVHAALTDDAPNIGHAMTSDSDDDALFEACDAAMEKYKTEKSLPLADVNATGAWDSGLGHSLEGQECHTSDVAVPRGPLLGVSLVN